MRCTHDAHKMLLFSYCLMLSAFCVLIAYVVRARYMTGLFHRHSSGQFARVRFQSVWQAYWSVSGRIPVRIRNQMECAFWKLGSCFASPTGGGGGRYQKQKPNECVEFRPWAKKIELPTNMYNINIYNGSNIWVIATLDYYYHHGMSGVGSKIVWLHMVLFSGWNVRQLERKCLKHLCSNLYYTNETFTNPMETQK